LHVQVISKPLKLLFSHRMPRLQQLLHSYPQYWCWYGRGFLVKLGVLVY